MTDQYLEQLWTLLLDGTATPEQEQELAEAMSRDPQFGQRLRKDSEFNGLLNGVLRSDQDDRFVEDFAERLMSEGTGTAVIPLDEAPASASAEASSPEHRSQNTGPIPPPIAIAPRSTTTSSTGWWHSSG